MRSPALLAQFLKQLRVDAVPPRADGAGVLGGFDLRQHGATGLVQVRAVVELAAAEVLAQIGHAVGQARGLDVVQAKLLKTG